jgi:hypothetical protein
MSTPEDSARINYRISAELKERLAQHAESESKQIKEVLDELVIAHLTGTEDQAVENTHLERDLGKVDRELQELTDDSDEEAAKHGKIIQNVMQAYESLGNDFVKIRLQALSDFRRDRHYWAAELEVENERELIAACQRAARIVELKQRKNALEAELARIHVIELTPLNVAPVTPAPKPQIYRVGWVKERGDEPTITRALVTSPPIDGLHPTRFRFPDGILGLVFEAAIEEYPEGVDYNPVQASEPEEIGLPVKRAKELKRILLAQRKDCPYAIRRQVSRPPDQDARTFAVKAELRTAQRDVKVQTDQEFSDIDEADWGPDEWSEDESWGEDEEEEET